MFNPLAPWNEKALAGFVAEGHRYFVRQDFPRAKDHFDDAVKRCFLFCHYKEYPPAREHFDAVANDPYRFLYDWKQPEHRERLQKAAAQPEGYRIFTNTFLPDWERHVTDRIKQRIRAYLLKQGWKPGSGEAVETYFYPHFGEVMIGLKFRRQELRIKFEEIERLT